MITPQSSTTDRTVSKTKQKIKITSSEQFLTQYSDLKPFCNSTKISQKTKKRWLSYVNALKSTKILNPNNIRYPGHSEFTSSNAWQNSAVCWTIPKETRFKIPKALNHSLYSLPNFKSIRATTQGIGKRKDLRPKYGVDSPPPNAYHIRTQTEYNCSHNKGANMLRKIKIINSKKRYPGPGAYTVRNEISKENIPITLKSRIGFFYDDELKKKRHCVSPEKYHPSTKWEENLRFRNIAISFGIGSRSSNENTSVLNYPGPGTYNIPGIFDRGYRGKPVLN